MELAETLEAALREFTAHSPVEVRENGDRIKSLADFSWEVRGAANKPLLRLWSTRHNLTRRVMGIAGQSDECLALTVERFGRAKPTRLEFIRVDFHPSIRETSRAAFCEQFRRILAEQFPDEEVKSLIRAQDLEHSFSESYVRGVLGRGSTHWAWLAVPPEESSATVENSLTFALLWLDHCRATAHRGGIAGVRLIVPKGGVRIIAHRVAALHRNSCLEIYEFDHGSETLSRNDPRSAGNVAAWIVPRRETQALLDRAGPALDPIVSLAKRAISVHASAPSGEVWLRFHGLAFACWDDGRVFFGITNSRKELTPASQPALKKLLSDLQNFRHPQASDTRHALFRAKPEGWLECLVREDITRIDACLDPRFVYAQVFANAGGEHGILDLLAISRSGRLAILELKATEHIHLPLQAAGYWQHVRHHLEQGHFPRYGYFPGAELQSAPPIVYLIAPALRFHPATGELLRHLSPEIQVVRVGLDENWRRGLRVVMRQ